jgi:YggT family protein
MWGQALVFLVTTIGGLFTLALLLRFMLQLLRAPARNPLSQFVVALTDFAVRPARRVFPGWWGLDFASLVLAWLVELAQIWIVLQIKGYELGPEVGIALVALALLALIQVLRVAVYIVMVAVILQAILSWVSPYNDLTPLLASLTRPFVRPFRKLVPPIGNVDLSPLFVLIVCQLLLIVPLTWAEGAVTRLL